MFQRNQKQIIWNWKCNYITVKEEPTKDEIERFWSEILNQQTAYDEGVQWLNTIEKEYCKRATSKDYIMD